MVTMIVHLIPGGRGPGSRASEVKPPPPIDINLKQAHTKMPYALQLRVCTLPRSRRCHTPTAEGHSSRMLAPCGSTMKARRGGLIMKEDLGTEWITR